MKKNEQKENLTRFEKGGVLPIVWHSLPWQTNCVKPLFYVKGVDSDSKKHDNEKNKTLAHVHTQYKRSLWTLFSTHFHHGIFHFCSFCFRPLVSSQLKNKTKFAAGLLLWHTSIQKFVKEKTWKQNKAWWRSKHKKWKD